jgi:uncharacterized alkaline shock family protein YloU
MSSTEAYYDTEMGRVKIGTTIIRQAIDPALHMKNKFQPANRTPVDISVDNGQLSLVVHLSAAFGVDIVNEAPRMREQIKRTVEATTGLKVMDVTLMIDHIFTPSEQEGRESSGKGEES